MASLQLCWQMTAKQQHQRQHHQQQQQQQLASGAAAPHRLLREDAWHRWLPSAAALLRLGWHYCVHSLPQLLQQLASYQHRPLCPSFLPPLPGSVS
jgi:hypothetical protein